MRALEYRGSCAADQRRTLKRIADFFYSVTLAPGQNKSGINRNKPINGRRLAPMIARIRTHTQTGVPVNIYARVRAARKRPRGSCKHTRETNVRPRFGCFATTKFRPEIRDVHSRRPFIRVSVLFFLTSRAFSSFVFMIARPYGAKGARIRLGGSDTKARIDGNDKVAPRPACLPSSRRRLPSREIALVYNHRRTWHWPVRNGALAVAYTGAADTQHALARLTRQIYDSANALRFGLIRYIRYF